MSYDQSAVRAVLAKAKEEGRSSLTSAEAKQIAAAYEIATPAEGLATSVDNAVGMANEIGFPVVLKIASADILHKTDAGGVITGIEDVDAVRAAYTAILDNAKAYNSDASIDGVQVQAQIQGGLEVIVGATTDPVFGKLVAFGLGGTLVEVLQDITFRLAPAESADAHAMLNDISGSKILDGVRGQAGVDRTALARTIEQVSHLVNDFPEISELDLNPVFASADGAVAADVRVLLNSDAVPERHQHTPDEILAAMKHIMEPSAVAVIGASAEDGKIGNSVMRNLIDGGYEGDLYPVHPKADQILGHQCYPSIVDIPGNVDIAIFCIPAQFVAGVIAECGQKRVSGAILIPSGFAEIGEHELQ
nr:acetate--CoA ligase family protein [Pseudomonadales bacterium]